MGAPQFQGPVVLLGGQAYTLAPLSFGDLDDCKDRMRGIAEGTYTDPAELQAAFVDVIHASLLRNHPDLPRNTVWRNVDWDTAPDLFRQVMERSLPPASGESRAASPSGASTGS